MTPERDLPPVAGPGVGEVGQGIDHDEGNDRKDEPQEHSQFLGSPSGRVGVRAGIDLIVDLLSDTAAVAHTVGDHDVAEWLGEQRSDLIDLALIVGMRIKDYPEIPPLAWRVREAVAS